MQHLNVQMCGYGYLIFIFIFVLKMMTHLFKNKKKSSFVRHLFAILQAVFDVDQSKVVNLHKGEGFL